VLDYTPIVTEVCGTIVTIPDKIDWIKMDHW